LSLPGLTIQRRGRLLLGLKAVHVLTSDHGARLLAAVMPS